MKEENKNLVFAEISDFVNSGRPLHVIWISQHKIWNLKMK